MSLTTENGMTPADIAAVTGGDNGGNWGGDGAFWIIVLFLFAIMGGWNNGYGNGGGGADLQRGFDQSAVISGINGINTAVCNGFSNAEISRNAAQMNLLSTLNANQNANTAALNGLAMSMQNCCCQQAANTADLKYTVATEACADRNAISEALRDVIASNTANTQAILDKMCQQEIDALKTQNANLQTQLNLANLGASQNAQTAKILADNAAQTMALEQYLNPSPIPAYVVANPNCCARNYSGCGCAMA